MRMGGSWGVRRLGSFFVFVLVFGFFWLELWRVCVYGHRGDLGSCFDRKDLGGMALVCISGVNMEGMEMYFDWVSQ